MLGMIGPSIFPAERFYCWSWRLALNACDQHALAELLGKADNDALGPADVG